MLASTKNTGLRSSVSTSKSSLKQKQNFFTFIFRKGLAILKKVHVGLINRTNSDNLTLCICVFHGDAEIAVKNAGRNGSKGGDLLILQNVLYHLSFLMQLLPVENYYSLHFCYNKKKNKLICMSDTYCVKCNQFFGNPKSLNMCSVCYKQHITEQKVKQEVSTFKIPEIPEGPVSKQADHSRCMTCRKKIGLLGYQCKGCECSYCNNHRLPEDHKCESNFIEMAKDEIKKKNPNITAPKIQQI